MKAFLVASAFLAYGVAVYNFFLAVFFNVQCAWLIPINLLTGLVTLKFVVQQQEQT